MVGWDYVCGLQLLMGPLLIHLWGYIDGKTNGLRENPDPLPSCPSQMPHTALGENPGVHNEKPVTNSLSCRTAFIFNIYTALK